MTTQQLIARGLLTTDPAHFAEPVTVSGHYRADNGYWYEVSWQGRSFHMSRLGKSATYRIAENDFERQYGAILDEQDQRAFAQFLTERFGA